MDFLFKKTVVIVMADLTFEDILKAQQAIRGNVKRTPLSHSATFSKMTGCDVYIKYENFQKAGSFTLKVWLSQHRYLVFLPPL
jgi:tryptophan synthase beta subunit